MHRSKHAHGVSRRQIACPLEDLSWPAVIGSTENFPTQGDHNADLGTGQERQRGVVEHEVVTLRSARLTRLGYVTSRGHSAVRHARSTLASVTIDKRQS